MQSQRVIFSFLAAGPVFEVQLPSSFDVPPNLDSPLAMGRGPRSFVFVPAARDEPMSDENVLVDTVEDRDGRRVDVYKRKPEPPLWRLHWRLESGSLYTHLREEDGQDAAPTTAAAISISEAGETTNPVLITYPPVTYTASLWPDYQEEVLFSSGTLGAGYTIVFRRPSELVQGQRLTTSRDKAAGLAVARMGLGQAIECDVVMGTSLADVEEVSRSIEESFATLVPA